MTRHCWLQYGLGECRLRNSIHNFYMTAATPYTSATATDRRHRHLLLLFLENILLNMKFSLQAYPYLLSVLI